MQIFFAVVLALQIVLEFLVGLAMAVAPGTMSPDPSLSEIFQLRNQGFIALAIGVATVMLWFKRDNGAVLSMPLVFLRRTTPWLLSQAYGMLPRETILLRCSFTFCWV